ncbi:class F sortase [Williamsia sp. MIQD14]|uniref:class F sortase n=1 Tax=Williamsia sp. MIQD14 TaxID=3425703 RepID=UPI003DA1975B
MPANRRRASGRNRSRWALLVAAVVVVVVGGCSEDRPSTRPFPEGDRAAAARVANPEATVVDRATRSPTVPGHIYIDAIGVNATVMSLGTEMAPDPFLGGTQVASFVVPPDLVRVGWWSDGPRLGAPGMAVLLGHSQVGGGYAVFNRLSALRDGDSVTVENASGTRRVDLAVSRVVPGIAKNDQTALQTVLADNARTADLAMITCSGNFDSAVSESSENTAVFARIK